MQHCQQTHVLDLEILFERAWEFLNGYHSSGGATCSDTQQPLGIAVSQCPLVISAYE